MEPTPNARTIESYDEIAEQYARETASETPVLRGGLDRLAEAVPGARVLEIGSGPGWDADYLEKAGLTVRRTDLTQGFIDVQRKRGKDVDRLDAINDDLGGPYDAVVCLHVLQHLEPHDLEAVLAKVAAALQADGRFLVSIPLGHESGMETGDSGKPYYRALRTESDFVEALGRAGLEREWSERSNDDEESGWLAVLARLNQPRRPSIYATMDA
ncbi:class I SAM-dependent methyltransferase [Aeromicrobium sp. NPDC092404]|uniref:class I SAM-dependent methyltransferase n=1 Tax=Aeromicrobium sp. NPDC092404 TaxID=3154976 RepID=UPI0034208F9C